MSKKILIVDDDPGLLKMYERILKDSGGELTFCDKVEKALPLISEKNYDLIITDFSIGNRLGTELAKAASDLYSDKAKVIMISGSLPAENLDYIKDEYNLLFCMQKPFNSEDLLSRVREILR